MAMTDALETTLDARELLTLIRERVPGAEWENDWLYYPKQDLRLRLEFGEMQGADDRYRASILFIMTNPAFDEDMVYVSAAAGDTPDAALRRSTEDFCTIALGNVLGSLTRMTDGVIEADVYGQPHRFHIPSTRQGIHNGDGPVHDLFETVREALPLYLGTKHAYWLELVSARVNGRPVCEARINGTVDQGLSDVLFSEQLHRQDPPAFEADKVFLLMLQDPSTAGICPFSKQQVGELTFRALEMLFDIRDEVSFQRTFRQIREMAPTKSLGYELAAFVPEIYSRVSVGYRDRGVLMPVVDRGKPDKELRCSQVRSYGYIEDAVLQFLQKRTPTKEENLHLLALSRQFHVIHEAIAAGTGIEDLRLSQLVYMVEKDYVVY
ncbi:MAG: hypothetical protein IJ055_03000 [Oscillospiraceae bacterium]|nr:hypothetical protein [Oscillospiraceae bacterium]